MPLFDDGLWVSLKMAPEAAECRAGFGRDVGVARRGEVELAEASARSELPVLRPLERTAPGAALRRARSR